MWLNYFNIKRSVQGFWVAGLMLMLVVTSAPMFVIAAPPAEIGGVGGSGTPGEAGSSTDTIPVISENQLVPDTAGGTEGADAVPGNITGGQATSSPNDVFIETGAATAGGELSTDVNSNEIQSLISTSTPPGDIDVYTLTATGTNDAIVTNYGTTSAVTGINTAESTASVILETGDAVSVLNIANIVNTNVINSSGFIYMLNELLTGVVAFDLSDLFFPGGETPLLTNQTCDLMSCAAEDITYNFLSTNTATITNDVAIEAISGQNSGEGNVVSIATGESYGAANVINIANTNIIDSNYRLLTVNGIGTLDGDLVLPSEALFRAFFGLANGMNQVEQAEEVQLNDNNLNVATVNNNLNTTAETGLNDATTTIFATTTTGRGSALSNVVNEVNKNLFGGDSLYMLIRVHGAWNGNVFGLPEGLSWVETAEGIVIYNTDAEIVPSEILQYDIDSYTANFNNNNTVAIDNNININSVSGENALEGNVGITQTGNAYAGANVLNVANTNVVGRNWIMAIMNIFGDFNGNVSFGRPDLWIGGQVQAAVSPVGPGTKLVYTYTIKNEGDLKATNVELRHILQSAHIKYQGGNGEALQAQNRDELIGTLLPGETRIVSFDAYVDALLPVGTTTISVEAALTLHESDSNRTNNRETLTLDAVYSLPVIPGGGIGTGTSTATTTGSGIGGGSISTPGGSSSGGGGGGGGGSSKKKSLTGKVLGQTTEIKKNNINPLSVPKISLKKTANIKDVSIVLAGQEVAYTVTVSNSGGVAYDAKVTDQLLNPIGAVVSEQAWDIGTIGAGEKITLDYTIKFASNTPSGLYSNTARMEAYRLIKKAKKRIEITDAVHTLEIQGESQSIGNVGVPMFVPAGLGKSVAVVAWETIVPTDSQIFFGPAGTSTPYNPSYFNYGYAQSSYRSSILTSRHFIALTGLQNGVTYNYRLRSVGVTGEIISNEYSFVVPTSTASTVAVN